MAIDKGSNVIDVNNLTAGSEIGERVIPLTLKIGTTSLVGSQAGLTSRRPGVWNGQARFREKFQV
jgi:hypothetical protein